MKRKERHTLEFSDGRRVKYRVEARPGEPHYFVYFRGPSGKSLERSTEEGSKKRAVEAAVQIIKDEYSPERQQKCPTWEEAIAILTRKMTAKNNRRTTINDYLLYFTRLRMSDFQTAGNSW